MPDREKVIKGLEHHSRGQCSFDKDDMCPYWDAENDSASLCRDALELLKGSMAQPDAEAATETQEYCERYEPTYNPEDGSL